MIYICSCDVEPTEEKTGDCFDIDCPIISNVYPYGNEYNPIYILDYLSCTDMDTVKLDLINMDSLYALCEGSPYYGECNQDSCIDSELERFVFDIWKMKFKSIYDINDQFFDTHIEIRDVYIIDGPLHVRCRIEYIYRTSWLRSKQIISITLGDYPLTEEPDQSEIERIVEIKNTGRDKISTSNIISLKETLYLTEREINCVSINYKFCDNNFWKAGTLSVRGYGVIDYSTNECIESKINLITGDIHYDFAPCNVTD